MEKWNKKVSMYSNEMYFIWIIRGE
jgi:hypothetical protein